MGDDDPSSSTQIDEDVHPIACIILDGAEAGKPTGQQPIGLTGSPRQEHRKRE